MMAKDPVTQIHYLIARNEEVSGSQRERLQAEISTLTRQAAVEFGRMRGWVLARHPFTLAELAGQADRHVPRSVCDHPFYYRDQRGRPAAIAVHLYEWPDIGPDVEAVCDELGLRYEAPSDLVASWWYPGEAQVVIYTPRSKPRRKTRRAGSQLTLSFPAGGRWIV
jgi:hypothetical protein